LPVASSAEIWIWYFRNISLQLFHYTHGQLIYRYVKPATICFTDNSAYFN
jgi:hypothetical protein